MAKTKPAAPKAEAQERKERIGTRVKALEDAARISIDTAELTARSIKLLHTQLEAARSRITELENQIHAS